jgi:hypothetical protein
VARTQRVAGEIPVAVGETRATAAEIAVTVADAEATVVGTEMTVAVLFRGWLKVKRPRPRPENRCLVSDCQ